MQLKPSGITFPDATTQSTAAETYDQSLNTTDDVQFNGIEANAITSAGYVQTGLDGIRFGDNTEQTTAGISRVVEVNDTQAGIRITQTGTGEAFRVEDSSNPDSSPFVISANGNVGIGTTSTGSAKLTVSGTTKTDLSIATSAYLTGDNVLSPDGLTLQQENSSILFFDGSTQTTAFNPINIQSFGTESTSGSFTWTKPEGAKTVEVYIFGAGGGGGSGARRATTSLRGGGGGAGSGSVSVHRLLASELSSTVAITVGAGGNGGNGQNTDDGNGNNGGLGGDTLFGNYRGAGGIQGNGGSNTVGGSGGGGRNGVIYNIALLSGAGGTGASSTAPVAGINGAIPLVGKGGGGGAGRAANLTTNAGGANGGGMVSAGTATSGVTIAVAGGLGGGLSGGDGGAGALYPLLIGCGTGGGGGSYITNDTVGIGGAGGFPSGGGGGGSASDNGFLSGAGGKGGNGQVVVITYF